jgi:hypothetical protein
MSTLACWARKVMGARGVPEEREGGWYVTVQGCFRRIELAFSRKKGRKGDERKTYSFTGEPQRDLRRLPFLHHDPPSTARTMEPRRRFRPPNLDRQIRRRQRSLTSVSVLNGLEGEGERPAMGGDLSGNGNVERVGGGGETGEEDWGLTDDRIGDVPGGGSLSLEGASV